MTSEIRASSRWPILFGIASTLSLMGLFVGIVSFISGFSFALRQFDAYWPYLDALALGFGIQVGLYTHLRLLRQHPNADGRMLAVSGSTSAASMVACCAHYLANLAPLIITTGIVTAISQYQVRFFWIGIIMNAAATAILAHRVSTAHRRV